MHSSEYKDVVFGLIFLKYISRAFHEKYDGLKATQKTDYTDPEDRDKYTAANVFWVPNKARWSLLAADVHCDSPGCSAGRSSISPAIC